MRWSDITARFDLVLQAAFCSPETPPNVSKKAVCGSKAIRCPFTRLLKPRFSSESERMMLCWMVATVSPSSFKTVRLELERWVVHTLPLIIYQPFIRIDLTWSSGTGSDLGISKSTRFTGDSGVENSVMIKVDTFDDVGFQVRSCIGRGVTAVNDEISKCRYLYPRIYNHKTAAINSF
jgi:hypothetical protein